MNTYEHHLNPLENSPISGMPSMALCRDYSVMRGYVWVCVGVGFDFAPLALLTAFSKGGAEEKL